MSLCLYVYFETLKRRGVQNEQKSEKFNFVVGLYDWALLYQVFKMIHPYTCNIYQINKNDKASQTERYV
jgi:hypothetical protein